jgi:hypothetical protein
MSAPIPASRRPRPAHVIAALTSLALALALAACGSSSPNSSAGPAQESEQQSSAKLADFARCMREHGVQAEVGTPPGGGQAIKIGSKGPVGREKLNTAQTACQKYQPKPRKVNLSPQEKVEREEAVQKFARCMREHGIEVHASVSGGGIQVQIHGHPGSGPNPDSPGFQTAQNTCQKYMSKLKGLPGAGKSGSTRNPEGGSGAGASLSSEG